MHDWVERNDDDVWNDDNEQGAELDGGWNDNLVDDAVELMNNLGL